MIERLKRYLLEYNLNAIGDRALADKEITPQDAEEYRRMKDYKEKGHW